MICNDQRFGLPEYSGFVAGDYMEIIVPVTDVNAQQIDLTDMKAIFSLINYADQYGSPVFAKECVIENGQFIVKLFAQDTIQLSGKYIYQISILKSYSESETVERTESKSGQGIITIMRNINKDNELYKEETSIVDKTNNDAGGYTLTIGRSS